MRVKRGSTTKLWASAKDTYNWAISWPCSTLSGKRVYAEFAENGDLVDYAVNGRQSKHIDGCEFTAMMDDMLEQL